MPQQSVWAAGYDPALSDGAPGAGVATFAYRFDTGRRIATYFLDDGQAATFAQIGPPRNIYCTFP